MLLIYWKQENSHWSEPKYIFFFGVGFSEQTVVVYKVYYNLLDKKILWDILVLANRLFDFRKFRSSLKKWSHFDLKCWVTGGTKIRPGIQSNWRIYIYILNIYHIHYIMLPIKNLAGKFSLLHVQH